MIIPNEDYEIINTPETSELTITELTPETAGEYVCEAQNRHGSDVTITEVVVMGMRIFRNEKTSLWVWFTH